MMPMPEMVMDAHQFVPLNVGGNVGMSGRQFASKSERKEVGAPRGL